jgi:acyl-CoA synthetase (AMP-forming)/AMP-acid ligase II
VSEVADAGGGSGGDVPLTYEQATAALTGPGGFFELATEDVLGEQMQVFANRPRSLRDLLMGAAQKGDEEYAVFDDAGERRVLTFGGLQQQVASVAAALADRGIGHGDRVAILAANCPEYIVTFWACASMGAVAVCFNGWWTRSEIEYGLEATRPALLVADRRRLARLEGADTGVPTIVVEDDFADLLGFAPDADLPETPIAEDDPIVLQFTSGTTGRPKAAMVSHRSFISFVLAAFVIGARDSMLSGAAPSAGGARLAVFPLFHLSGMQSSTVTSLMGGIKTVWPMGRFDPARVVQLTIDEGITAWNGTGTHIHRLLAEPGIEDLDAGQVTSVAIGGSASTPELIRATEERFPHLVDTFGSGYGLTESGGLVSHATNAMLRDAPGCVGCPLPTIEVRIIDDEGNDLPDGENGEICVRSPLVMLGYWNDPAANEAAFLPGRWLRTGDFGRMLDGRLHLASRLRDLILRGGENVYPAEVEQRIEEHPAVGEVAVYGVDHPTLGQEVKAVVVLRPGAAASADEITAFCAEAISYYKVPTIVEFRDEPLPRNATGKVVKAVLAGDAEHTFVEE